MTALNKVGDSNFEGLIVVIRRMALSPGLLLWLAAVALSGLGLASVLMLGPYLQAAAVVLIGGETSEIYDGIRKQGIEGIAAYWDQVVNLIHSPVLVCGICTAAIMAAAKKKIHFLTFASLSVAAGWTIIDVSDSALEMEVLLPSLLCNVVGGVALALFSYVVHVRFAEVRKLFGMASDGAVCIAWLLWPPFAYFSLSVAIFFFIAFIIKIPTEQVSITLDMPLKGYYWVSDSCGEEQSCSSRPAGEKKFGIMEELSGPGTSVLHAQSFGSPVSVKWLRKTPGESLVQVRVAQGCIERESFDGLLKLPPVSEMAASSLSFALDDGFHQFNHLGASPLGRVEIIESTEPVAFHLNPAKESGKMDLDRLVSDGVVRIEETISSHSYNFGLVMFESEGEVISGKNRDFSIHSPEGDLPISLRFFGENVRAGDELSCELVKVDNVRGTLVANISSPIANLIISIPSPESVSFFDMRSSEWSISKLRGWVSTHNWPSDERDFVRSGKLQQISVSGMVRNLQVSDFSISDRVADVRIAGDLTGYSRGESISFVGDARYVDVDGHRRTPTRWESLDAGYKIPILLGVPAAIWFVLQILINSVRQRVGRVWRSFRSYM